jgi:hypothetical protein
MGYPGQMGSPRLGRGYAQSVHSFNQFALDGARYENDSMSILVKEEGKNESGSLKESDFDIEDAEALKPSARPFVLTQSIIVSTAFLLIIVTSAGSIRDVLVQVKMLGSSGYNRFAIWGTIPMTVALCLFFFTIIVNCVFQLVGPIKDIRCGNSKFYSSVKPDRKKHPNIQWPHITIQVPVYKEGLKGVIQPTVDSLLPAIARYESVGGTASIFMSEDGMQVISPELAELRKKFYQQHNIGWVARPPHGKNGFVRGGRFKKASNLNYALDFTLRVEDELLGLINARAEELGCTPHDLTAEEENKLYEQALETMLERDEGRTMAVGNIRMGEIILLLDSDTRVASLTLPPLLLDLPTNASSRF